MEWGWELRVVWNRGREEGYRREPSDTHTHINLYLYSHTYIQAGRQTDIHKLTYIYIHTEIFGKSRGSPRSFVKIFGRADRGLCIRFLSIPPLHKGQEKGMVVRGYKVCR